MIQYGFSKDLSCRMVPEEMAAVLWAPNQLCYCVCFLVLFVTYFVHNVSATVWKKNWKNIFFFNESEPKDLLQTPDKAQIPVIHMKKRRIYRGSGSRGAL
jgi:hypothetical protein